MLDLSEKKHIECLYLETGGYMGEALIGNVKLQDFVGLKVSRKFLDRMASRAVHVAVG